MAITSQRVNQSEFYIRANGVEYRRTATSLRRDIQRGDTAATLAAKCIDEIRALMGGLADELHIELEADGTPKTLAWYEPGYRTRLEDAGLLPRRG